MSAAKPKFKPDVPGDLALVALVQDAARHESEREAAARELMKRHKGLLGYLRRHEVLWVEGVEYDEVAEDAAFKAVFTFDKSRGATPGWWLGRKALWAMRNAVDARLKEKAREREVASIFPGLAFPDPGATPEELLDEALDQYGDVIAELPSERMRAIAVKRLLPWALGLDAPGQAELAGEMGVGQQYVSRLERRAKELLASKAGEPWAPRPPSPVLVFDPKCNGRLPQGLVVPMEEGQRAAMFELYEKLPAQKRAAGLCPEGGCTGRAWSTRTGRCRRCATRWPRSEPVNPRFVRRGVAGLGGEPSLSLSGPCTPPSAPNLRRRS